MRADWGAVQAATLQVRSAAAAMSSAGTLLIDRPTPCMQTCQYMNSTRAWIGRCYRYMLCSHSNDIMQLAGSGMRTR